MLRQSIFEVLYGKLYNTLGPTYDQGLQASLDFAMRYYSHPAKSRMCLLTFVLQVLPTRTGELAYLHASLTPHQVRFSSN